MIFQKAILSKAIREGAKLSPQTTGTLARRTGDGHMTCAFGAAYEFALDGPFLKRALHGVVSMTAEEIYWYDKHQTELAKYWDVIRSYKAVHPVSGGPGRSMAVAQIIVNLNDGHSWTRERIADWVEGVEKELGDKAYPIE